MHGFFYSAQPYLIVLASLLFPGLTLLYARRDKHKDETKTAGQQFIDNIVKDNVTLRADVETWRGRAEVAEKELERRDNFWKTHRTNAPEIFDLMDAPDALLLLKANRDKHVA